MKKAFVIIGTIATLGAACNKSDVIAVQDKTTTGWHIVTLNASADSELTKTAYAGEKTFSWTTGDKISVLMNNGSENKFFTLEAQSAGSASATFSGSVLDGYDYFGSFEDGTKWALYPASNEHEFHDDWTNSKRYKILFHVPSEVDLSTNFSANIPMLAQGDGENNYVFSPLSSTFKFTFKVAEGIDKVTLRVSRPDGYYLSGKFPLRIDSGNFLEYAKRDGYGEENAEVSITRSVETVGSDHIAAFYLPYRIYQNLTTPTIQLINADNGYTLFSKTAKSLMAEKQDHIIILPTADFTAKGLGSPYVLASGFDWADIDMYPLDGEKEYFSSNNPGNLYEWKATSDEDNVYLFYKIAKNGNRVHKNGYITAGFDLDNDAATGGEKYSFTGMDYYFYLYSFSNESPYPTNEVVINTAGSSGLYQWGGSSWTSISATKPSISGIIIGDYVYIEARLPRASIGSPASSSVIRIDAGINSYPAGAQTITLK